MTTNNHPAHGPVSLDRLHQISEILSKAAAQSDGGNLGYAMADAVKVINGAIAAFSAEPVLYAAEETLAYAKMGELHLKCLSQPMGDAVIPLYTAPPAPVVPKEMYWKDAPVEGSTIAAAYATGWNACRAAMLKSFGNSEQLDEVGSWNNHRNTPTAQAGNSPVTPDGLAAAAPSGIQMIPDGYVMVPKEPTAKMYDAGDQQMATKQVWDAMIAAAPQPQNSPQNIPEIIPGWIPVSERMPEVGVKVLFFPVEDEPIHASFNGQLWLQDISWSVSDESIDNVISCNVTHWMPLPAAPKEVG